MEIMLTVSVDVGFTIDDLSELVDGVLERRRVKGMSVRFPRHTAKPRPVDGDVLKDAVKHKHKWYVCSTAVSPYLILVICECGKRGHVKNPSKKEWAKAFRAPSAPYEWPGDAKRIVIE